MEFNNNFVSPDFQNEYNIFIKHFDPKIFDIQIRRNKIFIDFINADSYYDENECFKLYIQIDDLDKDKREKLYVSDLKYTYPNNCNISGSELLYKLYQVAKELNLNIVIPMDHSSFRFGYENDINSFQMCEIKLSIYNILLKGISWYNQFGYYTPDFESEKIHNEEVRNYTILQYYNNNTNLVDWIINYLKSLPYDFTKSIDKNTKIKDIIKIIDLIRNDTLQKGKIYCDNKLLQVINSIIQQYKIKYNYRNLELDITNPETQKIYENLTSKLKFTTGGKKYKKYKNKSKNKSNNKSKKYKKNIKNKKSYIKNKNNKKNHTLKRMK